jgi:8-amino-7-oxononanoate synthase
MFEQELSQLKNNRLLREAVVVDPDAGPYVLINGKKLLLLCSNDYLGLAAHPALREAASAAMEQYGFGSGASRLVSGTSVLHRELEERTARFKGAERALLFNSGYAANTGIIPAVAGEGDVILSDSLNHASIIDGCRLSRAAVEVYRHKDANHVESLLKKNSRTRRKLIVTDGVFSMDGDLAPLPDLAALAGRYGAMLMVDDAHATGFFGKTGRGTVEHFGLDHEVHIQMGTFSKALGSFGAFAAGSRDLIDYLINLSRSFIFSTALPPAVCAASMAALNVVRRKPDLRDRLWKNRERFVKGLKAAGINIGPTESPIVPVIVGDASRALAISEKLLETGIFAAAIRPPTVPEGFSRIRTTVTAAHAEADIDHAVRVFSALKQKGHIP